MELKQSGPEVTDTVLRLPAEFPAVPDDVLERFPSMAGWQQNVDRWWRANQNVLNDFSNAVTNVQQVGGVLTVDGDKGAMYIRKIRGAGSYADPDTAFFVDDRGYLSLGNSLTWNPETTTLTITGTIIATAGTIGGFDIGTNYIRDSANSFGLSSVTTGGDDVRFWAGDTFANRATAPFRVYESGLVVATNAIITGSITVTSGTIGGFNIGSDYIRDAANSFGLASTVTGADDVRIWAGDTFANRASAPFRVSEAGYIYGNNALIGAFEISATTIQSSGAATAITIAQDGTLTWTGAGADPVLNRSAANEMTLTSNLIVTGSLLATSFSGIGSSLTTLNASNISSGTLANARLPSAISVTSLQTANFSANVTTAVDVGAVNFRVFSDAGLTTQRFRVEATTGSIFALTSTGVPAGGTSGSGLNLSSTSNFGIYFGSGAPSLNAAQGSLYLRSDGSGTADRLYVNTNGAGAWTNFASAI